MTMSKALERSIDMVKVRWGGQSWLKPPCVLVVEGELGSCDEPVRMEVMLSGGNWEVVVKFWKQ